MIVAGVDGCRTGWIMVKCEVGEFEFGIYERFEALLFENPDLDRILIDIPLGLSSEHHPRTIDKVLRAELKGRSSTVFTPACRVAIYKHSYEEAKKTNLALEGKSLSIQSYNISSKIRELDDLLIQKNPVVPILESHPELCFKYLNQGKVLSSKKSTPVGLKERLELLSAFDPQIKSLFEKILASTKRKEVAKDDIIDAICLCLVNKLGHSHRLQFLKDQNLTDARGIEMKIAYYNPFSARG